MSSAETSPHFKIMTNNNTTSRSPTEPWERGLPRAAETLRNLLRDADSASSPLWAGPQLEAAVYRYTEIFLPMLAAHLGAAQTNARIDRLLQCADSKYRKYYRLVNNGEMYRFRLSKREDKEKYLKPFEHLYEGIACVAPIPPLDVAFCWALHRLSTKDYENDCIRMFGMRLEAKNGLDYVNAENSGDDASIVARFQWSCFSRALIQLEKRSFRQFRKRCIPERKTFLPKYLWPRFTKGGDAPTCSRFPFNESTSWAKNWVPPIHYDIFAAAKRQKQFLFNVSAIYFETEGALKRGVHRYKRFLSLMRDNPGQFFVPMYDIDLVWHAHILRDTIGYGRDTRLFVGRFIDHKEDDDRKQGGELQNGFGRTSELWKQTYDEPYEDENTNYRGKLPDSELRVFSSGGVVVKADNEWRKKFVADAVSCQGCKDKIWKDMHEGCRKKFIQAVRLKRGGQVRGGACGAMFAKGYIGAVATNSLAGGACGGVIGNSHGGCGCGGGAGACGAIDLAGGGGGCAAVGVHPGYYPDGEESALKAGLSMFAKI